MKHLLYLAVVLLSFFSCKSQKIIFGDYKNATFDTKHVLRINPDTTFYFFMKEGLNNDTIAGTWKIDKNKLILNSYITKSDIHSFLRRQECDTCNTGINIKVLDFESKFDLQYASISAFYQGNVINKAATNENGNATIKDQEIDSIKVDYVGYDSFTFMPNDNAEKLFIINMKLKELSRTVITNEVWKIKKNQIVSPNGLVLRKQ